LTNTRSRTTKRPTTPFQWRIGPATLRKVRPYTTQAIVSLGRRMVHRRSINFHKSLQVITTYCLTLLGQASGHRTVLKKIAFRAEGFGSTGKRTPETPTVRKSLQAKDYVALGAFRHAMRKLLRFSKELVATRAKLTTEQYDALLATKGS